MNIEDDYLLKILEYIWLLISGLCIWFYREIVKMKNTLTKQELDNFKTYVSHSEFQLTLNKFEINQEKLMNNLNESVSDLKKEVKDLNHNLIEILTASSGKR